MFATFMLTCKYGYSSNNASNLTMIFQYCYFDPENLYLSVIWQRKGKKLDANIPPTSIPKESKDLKELKHKDLHTSKQWGEIHTVSRKVTLAKRLLTNGTVYVYI